MWNFRATGNLKNDVDSFINMLKDEFKSFKQFTAKNGELLYFIHSNNSHKYLWKSSFHGQIYVLADIGTVGILAYECHRKRKFITLHDIWPYSDSKYYNQRIGTSLLSYLEEFAVENEVDLIQGRLSYEDHLDRSIYFYNKNGFIINNNDWLEKILR